MAEEAAIAGSSPPQRLVSLDAYRGFIMLAMASAGLRIPEVVKAGLKIPEVAKNFSEGFWPLAAAQADHVAWVGCATWDLIQPAFMFMVGVAVPYSFASRQQKGQTYGQMVWHAVRRSAILIVLAVFLSSPGRHQTNFVFENVLAQIGLGYVFVFLLCGRGWKTQAAAAIGILVASWLLFFLYPAPQPGPSFDYEAYGLPHDWPLMSGVAAHWNKHTNVASQFDLWFLNLFPREKPYVLTPDGGGYATLNFIPSIATMILGLMVGELLRSGQSAKTKLKWLVFGGAWLLLAGLVAGATICPVVKRIWTPSFAPVSGALVVWMLAAFYAVVDVAGWRRWTFPLVVVGMNSIAMYCMSQLSKSWVWDMVQLHFGPLMRWKPIASGLEWVFGAGGFDPIYLPIVKASATLLVLWLICYWMYRQKIFIRI